VAGAARGHACYLSRFAQGTIRAVIDRVLRAADGPTWLRRQTW